MCTRIHSSSNRERRQAVCSLARSQQTKDSASVRHELDKEMSCEGTRVEGSITRALISLPHLFVDLDGATLEEAGHEGCACCQNVVCPWPLPVYHKLCLATGESHDHEPRPLKP